jgi:hypothetical protein
VGEAVWRLLFLWSFCVFVYISVIVEESVCVRDCRGLGLCQVSVVGCSVGDECEGCRDSLVIGEGRMGGEDECWGKRVGRGDRTNCWMGSNVF